MKKTGTKVIPHGSAGLIVDANQLIDTEIFPPGYFQVKKVMTIAKMVQRSPRFVPAGCALPSSTRHPGASISRLRTTSGWLIFKVDPCGSVRSKHGGVTTLVSAQKERYVRGNTLTSYGSHAKRNEAKRSEAKRKRGYTFRLFVGWRM